MFINFTNHSSSFWSDAEKKAANQYGDIFDIQFPDIPAGATSIDVEMLANKYVEIIAKFRPEAVLCQGEFCMSFAVIKGLLKYGIKVVAACSERETIESQDANGNTIKTSVFNFVQFREFTL